jgi:hypothetical protein
METPRVGVRQDAELSVGVGGEGDRARETGLADLHIDFLDAVLDEDGLAGARDKFASHDARCQRVCVLGHWQTPI